MEHTREWKKLQGKIVKILSEKQETLTGDGAKLLELTPLAQDIQKRLRRINKAMSRSRKATNPAFFNRDETAIRIDRLPACCLTLEKTNGILFV